MSIFAWRTWNWCAHPSAMDTVVWTVSVSGTVTNTTMKVPAGVKTTYIDYSGTNAVVTSVTTPGVQIDYEDGILRGSYGHTWPVGEALHATCHYAYSQTYYINRVLTTPRLPHSTSIPDAICSCGVYAMKQPCMPVYTVPAVDSIALTVLGVVEIWGKIIMATDGYRAEYAQLRALIDVPNITAETYQVPNLPSIEYAKREYFE
jgi:hypothetical protein